MADTQGLETTPLSELASLAGRALNGVAQDADASPEMRDIADGPAVPALLRELGRAGVDGVTLPDVSEMTDAQVLGQIMHEGAHALQGAGAPLPDLEKYVAAGELAAATGEELSAVLDEFEHVMPLEVGAPQAGGDIATMPAGEAVVALESAHVARIEGVEPQTYQEYDVHLMAYPIPATGKLASHGFVVVVPHGTDISDPGALSDGIESGEIDGFVTRGGPDGGLFVPGSSQSSASSDSSVSDSSQSSSNSSTQSSGSSLDTAPDGRPQEGDVYISDSRVSLRDLREDGVYLLETHTITGDIDRIEADVLDFREDINEADINYYFTSQNSNTYAGDVYEKLTGDDPTNTGWRPLPGLDNDLMNYQETDHANDFGL